MPGIIHCIIHLSLLIFCEFRFFFANADVFVAPIAIWCCSNCCCCCCCCRRHRHLNQWFSVCCQNADFVQQICPLKNSVFFLFPNSKPLSCTLLWIRVLALFYCRCCCCFFILFVISIRLVCWMDRKHCRFWMCIKVKRMQQKVSAFSHFISVCIFCLHLFHSPRRM